MKVIAFYLPQFHETKENNEWWGEGFTEWTNVKSSVPLFKGHYQPRVPLNKNYYNLLDNDVKKWQIQLAKQHGIYGFCCYHYWFEGKMLLEKPMEQYLAAKELDFPFCFCWANETWASTWATNKQKPRVLALQTYGGHKAWKEHFEYLLPFFKDRRYICIDGKPLFVIYRPEHHPKLNQMIDYWQNLAKENGLSGIVFASQQLSFVNDEKVDKSYIDYCIEYQPSFALQDVRSKKRQWYENFKGNIVTFIQEHMGMSLRNFAKGLEKRSYDEVWEKVLQRQPLNNKMIPGAFVDWDNSPRYGKRALVFKDASPSKFKRYFKQQIVHARDDYKKDMIFIFAWNEWSEGGYLEPDERYGTGYLQALKEALIETGELE